MSAHSISKDPVLKGLRILVVEDAPDNQLLIGRYLRLEGAEVVLANNGLEALQAINQCQQNDQQKFFDVALMDIQMPIMDGLESARRIRAQGCTLPLIALTAHTLTEERAQCLEVGFDAHLEKPIDFPTMITTIAKFSRDSAQQQH